MTAQNNPFMIPIKEFLSEKQSNLFNTLKQPQFTGELVLTSPKKEEWIFYMYLGRVLYVTGGSHSVRRWKRNVLRHKPNLTPKIASLADEISSNQECWEYEFLNLLLKKGEIDRKQLMDIIRDIVAEVLFDLTQTMEVTFQLKTNQPLSTQLVLIDPDLVIMQAWRQWQQWQKAKLADRSPNSAPIIRQKEGLRGRTTQKSYDLMTKLFNGKNTIRDLTVPLKQDIVQVTNLMMPYIQLGFVELITVDDIPAPLHLTTSKILNNFSKTDAQYIACIDNDSLALKSIKTTVQDKGFKFASFNDTNYAIASMLDNKPDFIFINLEMPDANGYDTCMELRKVSAFKNVPIVIMTRNFGLMDKMRGKLVGCSDILSKPVKPQEVLTVISKYLK